MFNYVSPHVQSTKADVAKAKGCQGAPGMAVRVVGLHSGAAHIGMVFNGKAMHLGRE